MLTKFETKSNRVKGLSFHPTRPWILASLHNGVIQLWDYRIRTLLDRFDEHDGPVRGICFHLSQPLFVSGGDDYKIKVWNYKQRRCLFTLLGHSDYIRTVQFHPEHPWVLSSSDDQMIRIWNWQSRSNIAVLSGHNHYVMCAAFHPKEDLVVSASLDQTVRVWDISVHVSGVRKKPAMMEPDSLRLPQNDLFGNNDAIVKYVLEGHDRGVNWAAFHPNLPLVASGADDRQVKLWRMNETKAWEVDTLRGHFNNVSCVLFHPRQELIISNSEDRTIRVWDMTKRIGVQTFRREHERFWILAAHPEQNLFAAGHDNGMIVFKLERERPAFITYQGVLFFVKDRYLRTYEFTSSRDVPILTVRRGVTSTNPRSLSYNAKEKLMLICSDDDNGRYELYQLPKGDRSAEPGESKRGLGTCAVFINRERFATLEKNGSISVRNLRNELTKKCTPPYAATDYMFAAPTGMLLLRSEEKITLYDVLQRRSIAEMPAPQIKYAIWAAREKDPNVALLGKDVIIIANKKLEHQCTVHETIRIKSGCWDESGSVFIYNTLNHIKYCLVNGDSGIIRTLDTPVYITCMRGNRVYCIDREIKNRVISIDPTEFLFKLALMRKRFGDVLKMVREASLIGQAIIGYLQKKGFPEVALYFVRDPKTRFNLALECGNIDVAFESAKDLDEKECWHRLGVEALRQGNHQVVEMAYQRTKNFERLSFLYLLVGNNEKLSKMLKIAEMRSDVMGRFHNSMFLGDVPEVVKILEEANQLGLAYVAASTYGLVERAADLADKLRATDTPLPELPAPGDATLLQPPTPVMPTGAQSNWPLLTMSRSVWDAALDGEGALDAGDGDADAAGAGWGDDLDIDVGGDGAGGAGVPPELDAGGDGGPPDLGGDGDAADGWGGGDLDDDLAGIDVPSTAATSKSEGYFVPPNPGPSWGQIWARNSRSAADHAAAGQVETALQILNVTAGIVNFKPLKPFCDSLFMAAYQTLPVLPHVPSLINPLHRNSETMTPDTCAPSLHLTFASLIERLKAGAYRSTTEGKFTDAMRHFRYIIHAILFLVVDRKEVREVKDLLDICREYLIGLEVETKRKALGADGGSPQRQLELSAYFTHCSLQSIHLMLSLRSAMHAAYKLKCFKTASTFGRRLLEQNPKPDIATQARKVVQYCDTNPTDACQIDYDPRNPFTLCCRTFKPIYKGSPVVNCSYCGAGYHPDYSGTLCTICDVAEVGLNVSGLQLAPPSGRQ